MIRFERTGKRFGNLDAVKDFSITIKDGEILGLLGPNGAGKTTLMLMMGTVYRPTSGMITVNGFDVVKHPNEVRRLIGIAFQDPRVDGILSGFEVLNWHLKMTTTLDKDERRKRVEDAKILVQRPSIAVFDEPTAFLDVPSRLLVWKMIRQLRDEGSTVIVATNMMDEAERLSERVAIVNKGKLVASETPEQLKGTVKGGEVLELTLNDGSEFRPDMLTKFPEVHDVKKQDNKILVFLNSGTLLLPKIVDTLSTQGFKIESVKLKEVSLEDVFLTYTGQRLE